MAKLYQYTLEVNKVDYNKIKQSKNKINPIYDLTLKIHNMGSILILLELDKNKPLFYFDVNLFLSTEKKEKIQQLLINNISEIKNLSVKDSITNKYYKVDNKKYWIFDIICDNISIDIYN